MNNTILTILNILGIMAELIELSVFVSVRVIALAIVLGQYTIEAIQFVYINRKSITEKMNPFNGLMSLWEVPLRDIHHDTQVIRERTVGKVSQGFGTGSKIVYY